MEGFSFACHFCVSLTTVWSGYLSATERNYGTQGGSLCHQLLRKRGNAVPSSHDETLAWSSISALYREQSCQNVAGQHTESIVFEIIREQSVTGDSIDKRRSQETFRRRVAINYISRWLHQAIPGRWEGVVREVRKYKNVLPHPSRSLLPLKPRVELASQTVVE